MFKPRSVQLGDAVLDAAGAYSPVYFFSHAYGAAEAPFVELILEGDRKISLSPDHYVATRAYKIDAAAETWIVRGSVLVERSRVDAAAETKIVSARTTIKLG